MDAGDVRELRQAGIALERVAPGLAIAAAAAIVDQRHRETVIHPGLHEWREAVAVVCLWPAMHLEDRWVRSGPRRLSKEDRSTVHRVIAVRHPARSAVARRLQ